jgi:hypothetical protein
MRERKKRGKASRKDLAQQAAAAAAGGDPKSPGRFAEPLSPTESRTENASSNSSSTNDAPRKSSQARSMSFGSASVDGRMNRALNRSSIDSVMRGDMHHLNGMSQQTPQLSGTSDDLQSPDRTDSPIGLGMNGFSSLHGYGRPATNGTLLDGSGLQQSSYTAQTNLPAYSDLPYSMQSPPNYPANTPSVFRLGESPLSFSMGDIPGPSSMSMNGDSVANWRYCQSSPQQYQQPPTHQPNFTPPLRYPVLQPLIPHLGSIVPLPLACDLLDLYFDSSSSAQTHPTSPYVLGHVFRKSSFLHASKPRVCSPALLASMLWVAAQTSDAPFLTTPPSARGRICQRLLELTVGLLKPLIHGPPAGESSPNFSNTVVNGVALGGLGVAMPGTVGAEALGEGSAFGAAGALDDVVTYIHLATVVSASEYKGASLRWWNAAWSLARELKLGRELPPSQSREQQQPDGRDANDIDADGEADDMHNGQSNGQSSNPGSTEEEREERRRIWWLVYIVDRHLSLCYNKPLFLMDIECDGLLQPLSDEAWQAGDFSNSNGAEESRARGPSFECTGNSIFGYFLPLMTILGEIVDLTHARNHPRFGLNFRSAQDWDSQAAEITRHLETYSQSLADFEARNAREEAGDDTLSPHSNHSSMTTASNMLTTSTTIAYSTHVLHVLYILLTGKWDPISLLEDADLWISTPSFISSTTHAVSAANALPAILEYDPGLEFMPFFFGVYLLQGSFLLLLIAEKLGGEVSENVVQACELVVRAHEACVVTLNTEYQVISPLPSISLNPIQSLIQRTLH